MPTAITHNEDVEEILSRPPFWMVRWGMTVIFILLLLLLCGTYFVSYSDTISGAITLTTEKPPVTVYTRSAARVDSILVNDGDPVNPGQKLLFLESSARAQDIYTLRNIVDSILSFSEDTVGNLNKYKALIYRDLQLGEIQSRYTELSSVISDFLAYSNAEDFSKKTTSLLDQKNILEQIVQANRAQSTTLRSGMEVAQNKFRVDSSLYSRQVISLQEYNTAKATLLDKQSTFSSNNTNFFQTQMQLAIVNKDLTDLRIAHEERIAIFLSSVQKKCNELKDAIAGWELMNVIKSPISGDVHLLGLIQNQSLTIGADAATIIPHDAGNLVALVRLPMDGAAKVEPGQKVIIRFSNYPSETYGRIYGIVKSIAVLPKDSSYLVEVNLPDGLKTSNNKTLEYKPSMSGTAEIVTEKMSLFERLFSVFHNL